MITQKRTIRADRFSDRKAGHPDQPAAQELSGAITGDSIMKRIPLTQGKFTIVDDSDYKWLSKYKWHARKCGIKYYAARKKCVNGKWHTIYMHREIMNALPNVETDHINCNSLNNTRSNLRICTSQQNKWNTSKQKRKKLSKYKGVSYSKCLGKWNAYIQINSKQIHLGYYGDEDNAGKAYNKKAVELFGEFANLNPMALFKKQL